MTAENVSWRSSHVLPESSAGVASDVVVRYCGEYAMTVVLLEAVGTESAHARDGDALKSEAAACKETC